MLGIAKGGATLEFHSGDVYLHFFSVGAPLEPGSGFFVEEEALGRMTTTEIKLNMSQKVHVQVFVSSILGLMIGWERTFFPILLRHFGNEESVAEKQS